jgi:hypothetical protein
MKGRRQIGRQANVVEDAGVADVDVVDADAVAIRAVMTTDAPGLSFASAPPIGYRP